MIFTNAHIYSDKMTFRDGSFQVQDGIFQKISFEETIPASAGETVVDLKGKLVLPGLIDIHNHGNSGYDFSTCDYEGLEEIAGYLGRNGITSFAATSMTMAYEKLEAAYHNAAKLYHRQQYGHLKASRLIGINMEGPYFSYGKKGAQDPKYLRLPDVEGFLKLYEESGRLICLADVAPELEGGMEYIRKISPICTVSIAHTEADYDTVCDAFACGATHMTHLFNGMNSIHHRKPGPVAAAFDTPGVFVELICDGIHIHPSVIRMVFQLFRGRVILISDALAACGKTDGRYELGEQIVTVKGPYATLDDGTIAGSISNLYKMFQNAVKFGVALEDAIAACTINPAKQCHAAEMTGSITVGKYADFLVADRDLHLEKVYIQGDLIKNDTF